MLKTSLNMKLNNEYPLNNDQIYTTIMIQIQIQITLFFPEIVHNNYMGKYKMNHRIT